MTNERETWVRHFIYLALFAAAFHGLQFAASLALWTNTNSAALLSYGLDAIVSAVAALVLASRVQREWMIGHTASMLPMVVRFRGTRFTNRPLPCAGSLGPPIILALRIFMGRHTLSTPWFPHMEGIFIY